MALDTGFRASPIYRRPPCGTATREAQTSNWTLATGPKPAVTATIRSGSRYDYVTDEKPMSIELSIGSGQRDVTIFTCV
jgi:hypothetical protein